jgi:uncharacterized membrane protein
MSSRIQALLATVMSVVLLAHAWLYVNFLPMTSYAPDPTTGRVFRWPMSRGRPHYMTHDQYWTLAVTGGVVVACMLALLLAPRGYRELGED